MWTYCWLSNWGKLEVVIWIAGYQTLQPLGICCWLCDNPVQIWILKVLAQTILSAKVLTPTGKHGAVAVWELFWWSRQCELIVISVQLVLTISCLPTTRPTCHFAYEQGGRWRFQRDNDKTNRVCATCNIPLIVQALDKLGEADKTSLPLPPSLSERLQWRQDLLCLILGSKFKGADIPEWPCRASRNRCLGWCLWQTELSRAHCESHCEACNIPT